jgi:hypothetical protein
MDAHNRVRTLAIAPDQTQREARGTTQDTKAVTSAGCEHAHLHCHALPAARGCAVGRPRRRAAAHSPLRPPTRDYSPICPPQGSSSLDGRPKSMINLEKIDRRMLDGLPTVVLAHVVDLVGIRDGVVTPSRSC